MINDEAKVNIRLNLALNLKDKTLTELKEIAEWVVGAQSNILPVTSFREVKQ